MRREAARIHPSDLKALARPGAPIRPELRPLVDAAASELSGLVAALGGPETVSPQRLLLAQDTARAGLLLRGLMARFAESGDPEIAARIGTLISTRRSSLVALGLDERREEIDLQAYIRQREAAQNSPQAPIAAPPDAQGVSAEDRAPRINSGALAGAGEGEPCA